MGFRKPFELIDTINRIECMLEHVIDQNKLLLKLQGVELEELKELGEDKDEDAKIAVLTGKLKKSGDALKAAVAANQPKT